MAMASMAMAQEICDNGIDDDGDGLIDINDHQCKCDDNVLEFSDITGSICKDNLVISAVDPDALSYQWYLDGVALIGETGSSLALVESNDVEGFYNVVAQKADGCC